MAAGAHAIRAAPPPKSKALVARKGTAQGAGGFVDFVLRRQLELSATVLAIILAGNLLTPPEYHLSTDLTPSPSWHLRSPFSRFLFLSFRKPDTRLYYKGRDDAFLIAWWVIALCFLREAMMRWVFVPVAKMCGVRSRRALIRFSEQGWSLAYYTCSWTLGLYINQTSPYRSLNTLHFWKDYPHDALPALTKWYYLVQTAFYIQQMIVINLEARRKDYYQMFAHHIITSLLMMLSYVLNFTRIGNSILCTMDLVDILLPLAKLFKYTGNHKASDATFAVFLISWIVTRHIIFGRIIWSVIVESKTVIEHDWRSEDGYYWSRNTKRCFTTLLLALQLLNCLWLAMILRILWKMFLGASAEDTRSDDEHEDDESSSSDGGDKAGRRRRRPVPNGAHANGNGLHRVETRKER